MFLVEMYAGVTMRVYFLATFVILIIVGTVIFGYSKWLATSQKPPRSQSTPQQNLSNPKLAITKNYLQNGAVFFSVRGRFIGKVETAGELHVTSFAVDGDESKTPVRVNLSSADSIIQFGEKVGNVVQWKSTPLREVLPKLQANRPVELRVVISNSDQFSKETLLPMMEKLLGVDAIVPTTFVIQPQAVAIL